jgi:S1-C subfamily serine protease
MAEGDVIVELAGVEVTDPQQYSDLLDKQKIGSKVAVRVRRGNGEVALQVTIGSRPRNR